MTDFSKLIKKDENLVNIRPRIQAISPKVYIWVLLSIRKRIKQVLKVCNIVFSFESIKKIVKMTDFSKFIKVDNTLGNIRPRIQAISPKVYIGLFFINHQKDRTDIEGVLRRVLVRIDLQL